MARTRTWRIAVAQLRVDPDHVGLNARTLLAAIDRAGAEGADFLVTPEMALTGYHGRFDQADRTRWVKVVRDAAEAAGVSVLLGCGDRRGPAAGRVYNEVLVLGGDGRLVGRHAKIVATQSDRAGSTPDERLRILCDRGLAFGCLICNDLWVTPGCGPYPTRGSPTGWPGRERRLCFIR